MLLFAWIPFSISTCWFPYKDICGSGKWISIHTELKQPRTHEEWNTLSEDSCTWGMNHKMVNSPGTLVKLCKLKRDDGNSTLGSFPQAIVKDKGIVLLFSASCNHSDVICTVQCSHNRRYNVYYVQSNDRVSL